MGIAVSSLMQWRHNATLEPHPDMEHLKAYGSVFSTPLPGTETADASAIYRAAHKHTDEDFAAGVKELREMPIMARSFRELCAQRKDKPQVAYRPVEKVVKELVAGTSREMFVSYLKPTVYITLGEILERLDAFGRGLVQLGVQSQSTVSIYEETRWEWLVSIYGLWSQNIVASTVYANLGEEALFYALHETESKAIICNARSVPNLLAGIKRGAFPPCIIIYLDTLSADCEVPEGVTLMKWTEVLELGREHADIPVNLPTEDDMALIMYTSGTTGDPKGVIHTHDSIKSGVKIMTKFMESLMGTAEDPNEAYCAYLPLAHILEFGVVNVFLTRGALVGFGSPRTITSATAKPHGDFTEYRPTVLIAVPRVFDTIRRVILGRLPPVGTLKRTLFDQAYQSRLEALKQGKDTPFYNEKIFKVPREALGNSTKLLLSGGGPISPATQEFVNVVFGMLINGWGLTETVCVGAIQRLGDMTPECTGQVLECEELKLVDTEEYKHTDKPEPRGEICLRGPFLFKGYYKQPELTKEAIDEDGWFHTGDVGKLSADGLLSVMGRIKALAKNSLGEYIPLEILESIYNNHPLVLNNCSCVLVHPYRNYIAIIAVSDAARITNFAKEKNLLTDDEASSMTVEQITALPRFREAAGASFAALAAEAKRKPFECVRYAALLTEEWTPENDVLTAAMKLKRRVIQEKFKTIIEELFANEN